MEYDDFRKRTLKAEEKKHRFKVTNSYGNKQAWRWVKKNKWLDIGEPLTEREFGTIIKAINKHLQDQLLSGKDAPFPNRMGRLEIRKFEAKREIREGKLVTNLPVNWELTLKLWYADEESKKNKTLIRYENLTRFKVYYNKEFATFNNKNFYKFTPIRALKIGLKEAIVNKGLDAHILKRKDGLYEYKDNNE